jgi:hypothetical protein
LEQFLVAVALFGWEVPAIAGAFFLLIDMGFGLLHSSAVVVMEVFPWTRNAP